MAGKHAAQRLPSVEVVFAPYEALEGTHAAVVTEWEEDVEGPDAKKVASLMEEPRLLVDGRNCLDSAALRTAGILYRGFGRGLDSD